MIIDGDSAGNHVVFSAVRLKAQNIFFHLNQKFLNGSHRCFGGIVHELGQLFLIFGQVNFAVIEFRFQGFDVVFVIHSEPCKITVSYIVFCRNFFIIFLIGKNVPGFDIVFVHQLGIEYEARRSPHVTRGIF